MEDHNKMDQQSNRPNRDQETDKKPTQGTQDINRQQQGQQGNVQPGNIQQGQQDQGQRDQKDKEKKSA